MHRDESTAAYPAVKPRWRFRIERKQLRDYPVRVIVAGSRGFDDYSLFATGMQNYVDEFHAGCKVCFITGAAKTGADAMIVRWCEERGLPWTDFPAQWDDLDAPGALVRQNRMGKPYNVNAGYDRNTEMALAGTHCIVWWDGVSRGTAHMREQAARRCLPIETILIVTPAKKDHHVRESPSRGNRNSLLHEQAASGQPKQQDLPGPLRFHERRGVRDVYS